MHNQQKIRGYMTDAGIPKKYWPMSLDAHSLDQPGVLAHITKGHLAGGAGVFSGVNLYATRPPDILPSRDVFLTFARELVLAGFSTKLYPLISLADALDDDRQLSKKDALHAHQVCILDFASEGVVDGLTGQQRARVQQYIMHRIDNRLGVSVHYPQSLMKTTGAAFGYSSLLVNALTQANYNEEVTGASSV